MKFRRQLGCLIFAMFLVMQGSTNALAQSHALIDAHQQALSSYQQGRYAEAVEGWSHAQTLALQEFGPDHPIVGLLMGNLGKAHHAQGNYAEAEPLFKRALEITEAALGPTHPELATSLNNLAALLQAQGNYAGASRSSSGAGNLGGGARADASEYREDT